VSSSLEQLIQCLRPDPVDENRFRGHVERPGMNRVFGGLVLAQAMAAANATVVAERLVHSQHGYFLRAGDPGEPIEYEVDRIRDGGSFCTRRVVARQGGRAILNTALSYQVREAGLEHRQEMPQSGEPNAQPDRDKVWQAIKAAHPQARVPSGPSGIEYRPVEPSLSLQPGPLAPRQQVWMRAAGTVPDDQALHRTLLVYMSDSYLLSTALRPHGYSVLHPDVMVASLDHALWMHDDVDCNEWLLYDMDSPGAGGGRGFSRGSIYQRDGRLVASTAQESLMRMRRAD
jgi:acyl-CoA thioesterase-2